MTDFDGNDIVLAPDILEFRENDTTEQLVAIENWSDQHSVFRVKASVSNLFVLGEVNGVVESSTAVEFPVALKNTLSGDFEGISDIEASISVEFISWADSYEDEGVRAFWATRGKHALKKNILCVVRRDGAPSVDNQRVGYLDRATTMRESESFTAFDDAEDTQAVSDIVPESFAEPESSTATSVLAHAADLMEEMRGRQESLNNGLKAVAAAEKQPSRRRSMLDSPIGGGLLKELKVKQEKLAGGELALRHVHVKTAAEKEQERLDALGRIPEGGFTNIMDELKHFSYILNQSTVEATSDPFTDNERSRVDSDNHAKQHAEEMLEKDTRISELNAEIHRLMEQHDHDLAAVTDQKNARISALEKQNELKVSTLIAQHEANLKNITDELKARISSLTEHYESRIDVLSKQQQERGDQEAFLEQQRVMMEAFTKAKDIEIKDTIMHQEMKFGALLQNHDDRIRELTQALEDCKKDKEDEITRLQGQHSLKVKGLMNQQAIAINTLSAQLESTMKVQRERVESLTKQLADLHQNKLAEAASLKQQYDCKLKIYTEYCEQMTSSLQQQVDDLTIRLQQSVLRNKVVQDAPGNLSSQNYLEPPHQLYSAIATGNASADAVLQKRKQHFVPQVGNPFIINPSTGGHGTSRPHYTTSVRQLEGRRPDRAGFSRDILGPGLVSPSTSTVVNQESAVVQQSYVADNVTVGPASLRFIGKLLPDTNDDFSC